ncbi:hypothetical protein B0H11DRAFT_1952361 [Mycena galericulata]|nr:hypothetical protein B0H11DRAFT_1952361 [Mycena galericulata]
MRITFSVLFLGFATVASAGSCAICPDTLLPGVSEITWGRVWNRDVDVMFCGYKGKERNNPRPVQTFCMYNDNGMRIEDEDSLQAYPKAVKVQECDD